MPVCLILIVAWGAPVAREIDVLSRFDPSPCNSAMAAGDYVNAEATCGKLKARIQLEASGSQAEYAVTFNLGAAQRRNHHYKKAVKSLNRAVELGEKLFGREDISVVGPMVELCAAHALLKQVDQCFDEIRHIARYANVVPEIDAVFVMFLLFEYARVFEDRQMKPEFEELMGGVERLPRKALEDFQKNGVSSPN